MMGKYILRGFASTLIIFTLLVMALPVSSIAQDADEPTALMRGDQAPFSGVLMPEDRLEELLETEIEADRLEAQVEFLEKMNELQAKAIDELARPMKWWRRPSLNRAFGYTVGIMAAFAAVWGAGQLDK